MLELFTNPGYLALAALLIAVPIVIHLINRLRFKRLRWAAMEFLLKAQKRQRRRLIIEQLLLLALRCLLVGMFGMLVLRFVGCSSMDLGGRHHLHLVLFDDTLSTLDSWQENEAPKSAFSVARNEILLEKIGKSLQQSGPSDRIMVIPFSKLALEADFAPVAFDHLNDSEKFKQFREYLDEHLKAATKLHVDPLLAIKKAQEIVRSNEDNIVSLHILGDFRQRDWGLPGGEEIYKTLTEMGKNHKDLKIRLIDTVHPYRTAGQGGIPISHDNVALVDLRPSTRIAGKNMPINFTGTIANFSGREADVTLVVVDELTGREMLEVDFNPPMPVKISPADTLTVSFDLRFNPEMKATETHFAYISARLRSPQLAEVPNDGLKEDNARVAAVEVRDKVPVLVIDGEGAKGRQETKDSYHIGQALASVPGASYQVVYGDELAGGISTKALERPDLHRFTSIYVLNVPQLTAKQLANLETFARDGGGVAFFLGPQVNPAYYNKFFFKDGQGVFPVPLKETFFPPAADEPLVSKPGEAPQVLIRDSQSPDPRNFPIFGMMFEKPEHREPLKDLPIRRYFQVPRAAWKPDPGRVVELATLPNNSAITAYQASVLDIVRGERIKTLLESDEFKKYRRGIDRHFREMESLVAPGSEKKAYHLAAAIDLLVSDKGRENDRETYPNLTEFWANSEPKIQSLRKDLASLREQVLFGDPFIVSQTFGKGRVVAMMTTPGKEWTDWPGGSLASILYPAFLWETQNYLSSQGREGNLTVGSPAEIIVDAEQYKEKPGPLKISRKFTALSQGKEAKKESLGVTFGQLENGSFRFPFRPTEVGLFTSALHYSDADPEKGVPLSVWGHAFNVDAVREGRLQRVSQDDLDKELLSQLPTGQARIEGPGISDEDLVPKLTDWSESPWLYLAFLMVLVIEQALAVHLSFHLRGRETDSLSQMTKPKGTI